MTALERELIEALELAVYHDGGTYMHADDELGIGNRACCDVLSYKEHESYCWVLKAKQALAKAKGTEL